MIAIARDFLDKPWSPSGVLASRAGRWTTWKNFDLGRLACVAVVCGVFVAVGRIPLAHTDLWGHLAYGRWIDENRQLPRFELFLEQAPPEVFQPHAWLTQWAGYRLYESSGAAGLATAHAALAALAIALLGAALAERRTPPVWIALGMLAAFVVAQGQWSVIRPQLFGCVALPLALVAWTRLARSAWPLVWMPALFVVMAQLHGTWLVVLAIFAVATAGDLVDTLWRRRRDELAWTAVARRLAGCLLGLLAASTNPDGPRGVWESIVFSRGSNLNSMYEWLPLDANSRGAWLFCATLVAAAVALRVSPRRWTVAEGLTLAVVAFEVLAMRRMLIWWALVFPWVVAPHLAARWPLSGSALRRPLRLGTLAAGTMIVLSVGATPLVQAAIGLRGFDDRRWLSPATPCEVGDWLARGAGGRVFAPMEWSDYLIWTSRGRVTPLVYSHVHLIAPNRWSDYRTIRRAGSGWKKLLEQHGIERVVLDRRRSGDLRRAIESDPDFREVFRDAQSLLFERRPTR